MITLVAIVNRKSLVSQIKVSNFGLKTAKRLSVFFLMALITAIILPLVYVIIRNYIIENVGMKEAGFWEGMNRISNYYLMFVNSLLALYILPRFSEIKKVYNYRN